MHIRNGLNVGLGRTTSVPKSALHYELDEVRYPDLETCSFPVPELKKVRREINGGELLHYTTRPTLSLENISNTKITTLNCPICRWYEICHTNFTST